MTSFVCLVTGASGQDGTYVCEALLRSGCRVIGTVRPGSNSVVSNGVEPYICDLNEEGAIANLLAEVRPSEIYNLAAESFSPACSDQPVATAQLLGLSVLNLLEAIRLLCPAARLVQASSSEMYGNPEQVPQDELTPLRPETIYGIAKAFAHRSCALYRQRHGIFAATAILFAHESPRRRPHFLSRKVARAAARIAAGVEHELVLGDLQARRDWSFAGDVADGLIAAMRADGPDDYVFASGELHTVADFCAAAFARVDLDWKRYVRTDPALVRGDPRVIVGDSGRAQTKLGWRARVGFIDLVHMMVDAEVAVLAGLDERGASSQR